MNPSTCSDREWFDATGFCGGCGDDDCHPGRPCGDIEPVFPDPMRDRTANVCDLCQYRVDTGQIRRISRSV